MKTFFSLIVVIGALYGAYVVNEKFLSGPKAAAKSVETPPAAEQMTAQTLVNDVPAYDPANPSAQIGTFLKGTQVSTAPSSELPAMKHVVLTTPQGQTIKALCKAEDLAKPAAPEAARPLEKAQVMKVDNTRTSLAKSKGTLGNGQTTISSGCCNKQDSVIKIGATGKDTKSSFGSSMQPLPAPVAPTQGPAQNIKEKAKDLSQPQPAEPTP